MLPLLLLSVLLQAALCAEVDPLLTLVSILPELQAHGLSSLTKTAKMIIALGCAVFAATFLEVARWRLQRARRHAGGHEEHHEQQHRRPYRRAFAKNRKYKQINWAATMHFMTEAEFRDTYGMAHATFLKLLGTLGDRLSDQPAGHGGVRGSEVMPPEVKLAMTLRWLRGGSYLDLLMLYGCSKASFYRTAYRVMEAICATHELELIPAIQDYQVRGDASRLEHLAAGFGRWTDNIVGACIGAIDGVQIAIKKPTVLDAPNPTAYINRKGFFALNVQAVADSSGRILWCSIKTPGATHDSMAFELSALFLRFIALGLAPFYFVGDDAYSNAEHMLCPVPGSLPAGSREDAFNYYQSLTRQPVERAFGMIERRFGILWRRLEVRLANVRLILMTIFLLHNLALDDVVPDTHAMRTGTGGMVRTGGAQVGAGARRTSTLRDDIMTKLADAGFQRPPHAPGMARA